MIRPDELKQMEIEQCDFEQLEKDIDEKIKENHGNYNICSNRRINKLFQTFRRQ